MASKPFVMILSLAGDTLFANIHAHLLQALRTRAHVTTSVTAEAAEDALQHLNTSDLAAVLVADCYISETPFQSVLTKLVEYAKSGRPVGGTFSSFMLWPQFPTFFGTAWGVQWKSGSYTKNEFSYNPAANPLFTDDARLPPSLPYMKGLYLTGFKPEDAVYFPKVWDDDDPDDEPDTSATKREELAESPIVYTRLGKGYLGYVGFINGEKEITDVVLAMLRL
jgi:hypothetical protein